MNKPCVVLALLMPTIQALGQTWSPIASPVSGSIQSCSFVGPDVGWIIRGAASSIAVDSIFRTDDGGDTWTIQDYPPDPPHDIRFFNSVHFINSEVGIIACGNYLYNGVDPDLVSTVMWTDDGGSTWTYKDLGSDNDYDIDAKLADDSTAYTIGQYGERKKTIDGGATWIDQYTVSPYSGEKLFPINADTVFYAGVENLSLYGVFGRTENGGSLWSVSGAWSNTDMRAIHFNDYLHGWIGGDAGEIQRTSDGGSVWLPCNSGVTSVINDLTFIDATQGWAVTSDGEILRSTDGGLTWSIEYAGTIPLWDIEFPSPLEGYAVGDSGTILKYLPNVGITVPQDQPEDRPHVYPNPASDHCSIICPPNVSVSKLEITDVQGRSIATFQGQLSAPIDVSLLDPGIYLFHLSTADGRLVCERMILE
jgi:photosystem II stability/assembly factor-like uncharacterized protein